jgi:quinol monooxygenase YgiN
MFRDRVILERLSTSYFHNKAKSMQYAKFSAKFPGRMAPGYWCRAYQVLAVLMLVVFCGQAGAQEKARMVRLARIVIDSTQLDSYKAFLREEIETSVNAEPGVLCLYAVYEKDQPTHITILEIYADTSAYRAHIQTPHFLKYKHGTKEMVRSLQLVDALPVVPGIKIK